MNYLRRFRGLLTGSEASQNHEDEEDGDEENSAMLPHHHDDEAGSTSPLSPISRGSSRYSSGGGSGPARKLKSGRSAKDSIASRTHLNSNAPESSEEESSTARLSRRSSVLVDLFALFRRSSSIGQTSRQLAQRFRDNDELDESDEEDGEYQEMSKEKLLEAIRQKKEIIEKVRLQPWNMRRKRRTLKVAQRHLQRQKAQVSKVHLYKVEFQRRAKATFRWLGNTSKYLIPWESKIKRIESHFGSVVSSYFIFLRWVLSVNITMSIILLLFVVIPEWLADMQADPERFNRTRHIKVMPEKVRQHADELNTVLDFGGYLQYSYLFYGYYSSETFFGSFIQYNVPIAYFFVNLFILAFCLFIILKKMTSNTRRSKLSGGKQEQYVFTWKVITGWDYNIGNPETASSLFKANVIKLREATADYNKKIKQKWTWMIFVMRVLVNTVIISMFALSVYAIYQVAQITEKDTFLKQNAVSITVVVTTILFPPIFELILRLERYRPRTALRTHLFRVLFFYLINYFTLIYSLFKMLNNLETEMRLNEISNQLFQQQTDSFHIVHNPYSYNQSYYEVVPSRSSRQIRGPFGSSGGGVINETLETLATVTASVLSTPKPPAVYYSSSVRLPPTTVEPMRPWTTVFPNYGPFGVGVYNPKAIVFSGGKRVSQRVHETVYESRAIGPIADWSPAAAQTTQGPVTLNYTTSPRNYYQMYRASNYDDLCWETLIGQEITKIVTTDLVLTIVAILVIDFLRDIWIRYCGSWWCWDIEGTFPEYAEFKVAENVLHLVNNQGMIWLGTILVPMLPMLNNLNLIILMYIRAWACMTCNVPARQIFRASRSSNFYYWILLLMLCMSTLPVGFVIASKKPSKNCGPFGGQERFYSVISQVLHNNLNKNIVDVIQYIMSPGIVIPVLLLMLLIIYFLVLLVSGLKAANTDLSKQLTHERTEEKKKIFELAGGGRKRPSQFTFHRPSDFNVRADSSSPTSRRSSPRSRSTRDFTDSPPRRRGGGSGGGGSSGGDRADSGAGGGSGGQTDSGKSSGDAGSSPSGGRSGGTRSSWHGRGGSGSPEGKTTREGAYRKRAAGIRRTVTERSAGALTVAETPFRAKSEDQLHSASKSPISQARFPSFLPSLQSVNEDDDEEATQNAERNGDPRRSSGGSGSSGATPKANDAAAENDRQRRLSTPTADAPLLSVRSSVTIDQTPVKLNWRQKMLVWMGLADPQKLELKERLRRQIERNKVDDEERRMEAADAEAAEGERRASGDDAERGFVPHLRQERRPLKSSLRKKKSREHGSGQEETALVDSSRQQAPPLPLLVVESGSGDSSGDHEPRWLAGHRADRDRRSKADKSGDESGNEQQRRKGRRPTPLLLEEADYSVASDEAGGGSAEAGDDDGDDEAEAEEVEEIPVIAESDDTSNGRRSSSTTTSTTRASAAPSNPVTPKAPVKRDSGSRFPILQSRSGTDRLRVNREFSEDADNAISESSPVIGRRREDVFPASHGDANRLSDVKRSPHAPPRHATGAATDLPPASPTRRFEKRADSLRRRSPRKGVVGVALAELMQASDDPTCAPSDDNSFRDPTPPASGASSSAASLVLQRLRRSSEDEELATDDIGSAMISDSFRYAEDPRLGYANPYSSYAAAMCSPITLSDYRNGRSGGESGGSRLSYEAATSSQQQQKPHQQQPQQQRYQRQPESQPYIAAQPTQLHHSYHQALQFPQQPTLPYPPVYQLPQHQLLLQQQYSPYGPQQFPYDPQQQQIPYGYYAPQQMQIQPQQQGLYTLQQDAHYHTYDPRWSAPGGTLAPPQDTLLRNSPTLPYGAPAAQMYDVPPSYYPRERTAHALPSRQQQQHRRQQQPQQRILQRKQEQQQYETSEQHQESPISMRGRHSSRPEEGGSTSGRGTMPPDYLTESPSGSSPEFGLKPKYRIAKSPIIGHRNDQGGYSSDTSGMRRFDIRQKSAVGGGSPSDALLPGGSSGGSSSPLSPQKRPATAAALSPSSASGGPYSQQTTV